MEARLASRPARSGRRRRRGRCRRRIRPSRRRFRRNRRRRGRRRLRPPARPAGAPAPAPSRSRSTALALLVGRRGLTRGHGLLPVHAPDRNLQSIRRPRGPQDVHVPPTDLSAHYPPTSPPVLPDIPLVLRPLFCSSAKHQARPASSPITGGHAPRRFSPQPGTLARAARRARARRGRAPPVWASSCDRSAPTMPRSSCSARSKRSTTEPSRLTL